MSCLFSWKVFHKFKVAEEIVCYCWSDSFVVRVVSLSGWWDWFLVVCTVWEVLWGPCLCEMTLWIDVACFLCTIYWLCKCNMGFYTLVIYSKRSKKLAEPCYLYCTGVILHRQSELSALFFLFFSDLFQCQYQTFSSLVFLIKLGGQSLEKKKFVDFFIKSISNLLEVIPLYTPVKTDKTLGVVVKVYELPVSFMLEKKYW